MVKFKYLVKLKLRNSLVISPALFACFSLMAQDGAGLDNTDYEAGRFIVKIKKGESSNPFTNKIIRDANLEYLAEELEDIQMPSRELPNLGIVLAEGDSYEVGDALTEHPLVEYYELERRWDMSSLDGIDIPSDLSISPWLQDVLGFSTARPDPAQPKAGGSAVIVAVIDTGLTVTHPYITSALAINSAETANGVDDDSNGYVDDIYGANVFNRNGSIAEGGTDHGSHVAGIIKTIRDQAIEDYPEAKRIQVLPIRFIDNRGYGTTTGAVLAMEYAAMRGARVVNASWGSLGSSSFS